MSMPSPTPSDPQRSPPGRVRFSLGLLLLLTFVFAVCAAAFGGLIRDRVSRPMFILLLIGLPMGVMVLLSLAIQARRLFRRLRK